MLNELFHEVIPVILHADDLNSMMQSIENRSPFLDTNLFNYILKTPPSLLIQKGYSKYILREAMKGILNEKVRTDRNKVGFNASINSVINLKDKEIHNFIFDKNALIFNILDRGKTMRVFHESLNSNTVSKFIFNFINCRIFMGT